MSTVTHSMTENVMEIAESIQTGDIGYLTTWLADIISESADLEETVRAAGLLEKMADYKPPARTTEQGEQYYGMEETERMQDKPDGRVSLKERLAQKKAEVSGQGKDMQESREKIKR